jgi:hypothetical protein
MHRVAFLIIYFGMGLDNSFFDEWQDNTCLLQITLENKK